MLSFCGIPDVIYPFHNSIFIHSFSFTKSGKRGLLFMLLVILLSFHTFVSSISTGWWALASGFTLCQHFILYFFSFSVFVSVYFVLFSDWVRSIILFLVRVGYFTRAPGLCHIDIHLLLILGWCLMSPIDIHLFPLSGMVSWCLLSTFTYSLFLGWCLDGLGTLVFRVLLHSHIPYFWDGALSVSLFSFSLALVVFLFV